MKKFVSLLLRNLHLLNFANKIHFIVSKLKFSRKNKKFIKSNQKFIPPPKDLVFETFGKVDYERYYLTGIKSANNIIRLIEEYKTISNQELNILEWGCGTGRVLHNISLIINNADIQLYGCDLNKNAIKWYEKTFSKINFSINDIEPPLNFKDAYFDIIYCTSVFTHLSEKYQYLWMNEIFRILKEDGIFLFTVNGEHYAKQKLTDKEFKLFNQGEIIARTKVTEGNKLLSVYEGEKFVRNNLLKDRKILDHIFDPNLEISGSQDIWIVQE